MNPNEYGNNSYLSNADAYAGRPSFARDNILGWMQEAGFRRSFLDSLTTHEEKQYGMPIQNSVLLPNPTNNHPSKASLDEIFKCFICYNKLNNPHMCPHCSKLCCGGCLRKWLTEQKAQCPHCRTSLRVSQLVNCRFVSEISNVLESFPVKKEEEGELCEEHQSKLNYYCSTCDTPVCSDCAMFGTQHKSHEFEHINKRYERHVEMIKSGAASLKVRLKVLKTQMDGIESTIEKVTHSKEERSNELVAIVDQMSQKLEHELKGKLLELLSHKGSLADEIEFLENMRAEIERHIKETPKSVLIQKSSDLVKMTKDINDKPISLLDTININSEFVSEVIPPYSSATFCLRPFTLLRQHSEVVYSENFSTNGLVWRLKVYPNGNGVAKGTYISVFLEMVKGMQESSKYEYRVELINQKNPNVFVMREFASEFETGECWGYNRFFKIDLLEKEGYLIPEEDMVVLKYYVRAPNYFKHCIDQKVYITSLESSNAQMQAELNELKEKYKRLNSSGKESKENLEMIFPKSRNTELCSNILKPIQNEISEEKSNYNHRESVSASEFFQEPGSSLAKQKREETFIGLRGELELEWAKQDDISYVANQLQPEVVREIKFRDEPRQKFNTNERAFETSSEEEPESTEKMAARIINEENIANLNFVDLDKDFKQTLDSFNIMAEKLNLESLISEIQPIEASILISEQKDIKREEREIKPESNPYGHVKNLLSEFEREAEYSEELEQNLSDDKQYGSGVQFSEALLKKLENIRSLNTKMRAQNRVVRKTTDARTTLNCEKKGFQFSKPEISDLKRYLHEATANTRSASLMIKGRNQAYLGVNGLESARDVPNYTDPFEEMKNS